MNSPRSGHASDQSQAGGCIRSGISLFPPLSFTAVGGRGRECDLRDSVFHGGWRSRARMRPQGLSADARQSEPKDLALDISGPIRAQGVSAGAEYFLGQSEVKESALALKYFLGQSEPKDFSPALSQSELKEFPLALTNPSSGTFPGGISGSPLSAKWVAQHTVGATPLLRQMSPSTEWI